MEQTECPETSAYKLQTPGNYPKESIQQLYQYVVIRSYFKVFRNKPSLMKSVIQYFSVVFVTGLYYSNAFIICRISDGLPYYFHGQLSPKKLE